MKPFKNFTNPTFGEIKTASIDGNLYFIATDVARALGYTKTNKAIHKHVEKSDITKLCVTKVVIDSDINIDESDTTTFLLINENGVNALVSASAHPEAKKFKEWVISEIIPSVDEIKSDKLKEELRECLEILPVAKHLLKVHQDFIQNAEERIAKLKRKIESGTSESKDEAQNDTDKSHTAINIPSDLNKLPERLKFILQTIGVIKQENGEWILADKYTECSCPKCSDRKSKSN